MADAKLLFLALVCFVVELTTARLWEEQLSLETPVLREETGQLEEYVTRVEYEAFKSFLGDTVRDLHNDMDTLKADLQRNSDSLKKDIASIEEDAKHLEWKANQQIGFTAYTSKQLHLYKNNRVIFDSTLYNAGNAYSTVSGEFKCPVTGQYFFSITTFTMKEHIEVLLVKGNEGGLSAFADKGHYDQGSNTWVTHCQQGTNVYLRTANNQGRIERGWATGTFYTGFSGFLLRAD